MSDQVSVNGKTYCFFPGETILALLRRILGARAIPTLCDAPNLKPFGSCRLCTVEVAAREGAPKRIMAACHTPVAAGSCIETHSDRVKRLRSNILELVLSDHPLECETCTANGKCELQRVVQEVGVSPVRYPPGAHHGDLPSDQTHPYLRSELSRCIYCYRCVRACDEVQGQFVLSMYGRGFDSRIIKGDDQSFADSDCVSCGACAQTCPTLAISDVFALRPSPAQRSVRTTCTYCGVGCNLEVAVTSKNSSEEVLNIRAPFDSEVNSGHTCLKGRYAFGFYNHKDRLRAPLLRRPNSSEFTEVSWDEALGFIARRFDEIKDQHGPNAIGGISSARCTNEENYLMQKFMRAVVGTNNIDGCARVCHAPTALGMQRIFGTGAATNSIADIQHTNCILLIGANPTEGHPVTGAKIKQAAMSGKSLIVIDPRKTELARLADVHLQLRPGTNVAVLNMMLHYIVLEGLVDARFIEERSTGYDEFRKQILKIDLARLEVVSGVSRVDVQRAARLYASAPNAMSFHGLGVTEHYQGTGTVMLIAQLALATGNIGRPGVGVNPLRGQNNVQGAADMGVQPHQGAGYLDVTLPENIEHFTRQYGRPVPFDRGLKIPEMFEAARDGSLKALWIMGEDVAQTDPNTEAVISALKSLDLLIVQELFMTDTARLATVVLPGASFLEKSGTFTNGERRIQRVNRVVPPLEGARPDGEIIVEIMNRLGYPQASYDPRTMLEEISEVVPFFAGVTWEGLGEKGKQWPVAPDGESTKILHQKEFKLGKAPFIFVEFEETPELREHHAKFPLILTTVRDLEHYNCGAMTRRTPNVEIRGEDSLLIHPLDASARGIVDGGKVRLSSARGEIELTARISDAVLPGMLSTTFHFPGMNVNRLTSDVSDVEAKCPEYKVVAVEVASA